jgi:hypothetical protein
MKFNNQHIKMAFDLIASLSVSHDAVDVIWAARQQLLMADKQFEEPKKEEVKNDG